MRVSVSMFGVPLAAAASIAIFALGCTVCRVAHAIEQYRLDRLIRPRARYTGVQPAVCTSSARQCGAARFALPGFMAPLATS